MIPRWNIPLKSNYKYSNTECSHLNISHQQSRLLLNHASILRRLVVVFSFFFIFEKLVSHLHREKGERGLELSPLGGVEKIGESKSNSLVGEGKLILLWNEYQMIGKEIYDNIFRRITDGECPVSNCRSSNMSYASPLVILQTDYQVHNRPLTSKLQRSHHLPHAKPALGELHVSHLQVGVGKCFFFDFPQDCLP